MALPACRKLADSGGPAPVKSASAMALAPPGMAVYGSNRAAAGGHNAGLFGTLDSIGSKDSSSSEEMKVWPAR